MSCRPARAARSTEVPPSASLVSMYRRDDDPGFPQAAALDWRSWASVDTRIAGAEAVGARSPNSLAR